MITRIEIENFKSIKDRIAIDLRDITLLYGENSSGKSAISQALQYARDVFATGKLDIHHTSLGGDFVRLGGFRNFVSERDLTRPVCVRVQFAPDGDWPPLEQREAAWICPYFPMPEPLRRTLHDYAGTPEHKDYKEQQFPRGWTAGPLYFSRRPTSMAVEIMVRWDQELQKTVLANVSVFLDAQVLVSVDRGTGNSPTATVQMNARHPCLPDIIPSTYDYTERLAESLAGRSSNDTGGEASAVNGGDEERDDGDVVEELLREAERMRLVEEEARLQLRPWWDEVLASDLEHAVMYRGWRAAAESACERFQQDLCRTNQPVVWISQKEFRVNLVGIAAATSDAAPGVNLTEDELKGYNSLFAYCQLISNWSIDLVQEQLELANYVGPVRRHYESNMQKSASSEERPWADGLGAWDRLSHGGRELADDVNSWLSRKDRFAVGYTISTAGEIVRALLDRTGDAVNEKAGENLQRFLDRQDFYSQVLLRDEHGLDVDSRNVGIGVSQLLPVLIAARVPDQGLRILEQPELHIHARLQAVLGDLLAGSILLPSSSDPVIGPADTKRQFLVETHSEFLLLRLMRRIRETTKEIVGKGPRLLSRNVAVYHVRKEDGATRVEALPLDDFGNLMKEWPDDLMDMSFREQFG